MKPIRRYRIKTTIIAMLPSGGDFKTVIVPAGEIVAVSESAQQDQERFVDMVWKDEAYLMFAQDLHERGEELDS